MILITSAKGYLPMALSVHLRVFKQSHMSPGSFNEKETENNLFSHYEQS